MGVLARTLGRIGAFLPERKTNIGAMVPAWEAGAPQYPRYWHNYFRFALEGYSRNEIVFACVEELATSAAEPRLVVKRKKGNGESETLKDHPVLELFEHPNPFMGRYQLLANLVMYRAVSGNAYLYKTRSAARRCVELWPLRPDRMFVIPDQRTHIGGWEYRLGDGGTAGSGQVFGLATEDVIQLRTKNPLDDWYGLPPLAVCAERVDTDAMMRSFTLAFFRNAGVPAGLLNITKQVTAAERQLIRDKIRGETGGPQNWHQLLVLDDTEATYTPMGMPLGQSGVVLPELDEISEARIAMAFGIPLEVIGARLGMIHGNRSTMDAARATLWKETLIPSYHETASDLTRGMKQEYDGTADEFDWLEFDLSTVEALSEDQDAKHARVRADLGAGIISVRQAQEVLGYPDFKPDDLLILDRGLEPMSAQTALQGAPLDQAQPPPTPPATANGNGQGKRGVTPADLAALRALAQGRSQDG